MHEITYTFPFTSQANALLVKILSVGTESSKTANFNDDPYPMPVCCQQRPHGSHSGTQQALQAHTAVRDTHT